MAMSKLIIVENILLIMILLVVFPIFLVSVTYGSENSDSLIQINNSTFKVLINDNSEHVINHTTPLKLGEGYILHIKSVDSNGAHLLLTKGWFDEVDTKIIKPWKEGATIQDKTYYYSKSIGNITNVTIIEVRLKSAVIGKEDYSATADMIWQISENPNMTLAEIQAIEKKEQEEKERLEKMQREEREKPKEHSYAVGTGSVPIFL